MRTISSSAVAYFVFNRPYHTERTFSALGRQRPPKLFIIADGPRPANPVEVGRCAAVRSIVERVDWPCEVHRDYAESNMGLKGRVSSGLDWVFSHVERAIVLEDDCLAHPDFFRFCDDLLERYADDERVSVITGNNFQDGRKRGDAAYYFSKYPHCWGWATWRRAWHDYRGDVSFWPEWRNSQDWTNKTPDAVERRYWSAIFDRVMRGEIDSWAYPWTASVWFKGGLTATPNVNLVSNIGFGPDATHTVGPHKHAELDVFQLGKITHPKRVVLDRGADQYAFNYHFGGIHLRWWMRLVRFPKRLLRVGKNQIKRRLVA